jgi:hypothetical protein
VTLIKKINIKKIQNKEGHSLFEIYELGDRVKRTYIDKDGNIEYYSGIIMTINNDSIDIFWDTINGKYQPQKIENIFNNCTMNDILNGNENFSSIKKERYIFKNIF